MRRKRFQFSLATLLLSFTIACLLLSLFLMYKELRETRRENQDYRNEYGHLTISDMNRLHAIEVHTNENFQWRWRVYVPQGRKFTLRFAVRGIPPVGEFPTDRFDIDGIPSGEHTVMAGVTRDLAGKRIFQVAVVGDLTMRANLDGKKGEWIDKQPGSTSWQTAGTSATTSVSPGKPLTLLRLRHVLPVKKTGGVEYYPMRGEGAVPSDGFLVWIEETKSSSKSRTTTGPRRGATP